MASTHSIKLKFDGVDSTGRAVTSVKRRIGEVRQAVTGVPAQILGLAGIGGFGLMLSGLVDVNAEMQTLKSSLKTVTGSTAAAKQAFDTIEQFALTTPYELNEVVESFIKLKSLGLDPSERALRSYGNTASAMGKSLNQMIEAVADASTGEFERLKEFGIRASKQGDQVAFTFQGITTTVANNADAIQGYLLGIGENQFGSAMSDQMKNLTPALSNLRAAIKGLQVDIGEAGLNDAIVALTHSMTDFINGFDEQQIQQFTRATINGFADLLEGVDAVTSTISKMPYLAEMGLVGYMLFGKKGLAVAAAGSWYMDSLGKEIGRAWEEFNPSQVVPGSGGFGGDFNVNPLPGYQLGDFNDKLIGRGKGFDAWKQAIREAQNPKIDETNSLLRDIADSLRNQSAVAVAG